jgi:hypothetical protein
MTQSSDSFTPVRPTKPAAITLGPLDRMTHQLLETGRCGSLSEVVRAGLRALERDPGSGLPSGELRFPG